MITTVCGEDNVGSRNYYLGLKLTYKNKSFEIRETENLVFDDEPSLFTDKRIYFIENLNKKINKKSLKTMQEIKKLVEKKEIELIDWEDGISLRELKFIPNTVREFKPSQNIFKLIEACYPGNFAVFLSLLHSLPDKFEDGFIFIMLTRHLRNLVTVKSGSPGDKLAPWQVTRLRYQTNKWTENQLLSFYDGLFRIDVSTKTGKNPFSFRKSLDILTSYYV